MPPKKKKGSAGKKKGKRKGKRSASPTLAADGIITQEMTRDQMEEHVLRLREELDREREERNYFQLERDKINTFWEIAKRQLDEKKSEVRNKDREMEESEERHQVEIKVYKQKVKHLLFEHQNNLSEAKAENIVALRLAQEDHTTQETEVRHDLRNLKVDLREQELAHEVLIKNLTLKHDAEVSEMRSDFELQARETESKYDKKLTTLRSNLDLLRKAEIHEIEERKNNQISMLMKNHEKAFSDIKNYYNDITLNNLALINTLRDQLEQLKKKEDRMEKQMNEINLENRHMKEPLSRAKEEVAELRRSLQNYGRDKSNLMNTKTRLKVNTDELKALQWEHEILKQRFEKLERERDDLYKNFEASIHEVQQKSNFKNLLLEKKLGALHETLERKEAQLNEVLSATNLDPTALSVITKKLEDVLGSKNQAIKELQYELARVSKAHNDILRTYEAKLRAFGISPDDLGFKPIEAAVISQQLGQGPAGLVSEPPY